MVAFDARSGYTEQRPRFRGRLHQLAFIAAIPAAVLLFASAQTPGARLAAIVYGCALPALYGISAAYHRLARSERARFWMRRADHSMIYVFIAASYTPFSLLVLKGRSAVTMLAVVWAGAIVGVLLKMLRIDRTANFGYAMYLLLGWAAIGILPQMARSLSFIYLALLVAGGILYTAGAVILAIRRPDPRPTSFGYHEVWHAMVVAAASCHYIVIRALVAAAH